MRDRVEGNPVLFFSELLIILINFGSKTFSNQPGLIAGWQFSGSKGDFLISNEIFLDLNMISYSDSLWRNEILSSALLISSINSDWLSLFWKDFKLIFWKTTRPTGRPVRRTQTLSNLDQGPTESGTDRRIFKILLALVRSPRSSSLLSSDPDWSEIFKIMLVLVRPNILKI